ncbi:metallophosphoesterase [Leptolyngbya sp. 7M]|uniref:metallophosphoesterase n=1 Tax=Leptolyngbya sp. 7M TaxID=2812896 RepID=UPI001B8C20D1|nr:metallophosphoesterase [Leptolyngbya sp. 7M]QYO68212.1 metallophosphoesterase [Leptolyngbya sp. 7M]
MTGRLQIILAGCLLLIGLLTYSYFVEPNRLVINKQEISLKRLDPAFEGLRIAAISDIHGGSNGASDRNLERLVESVNSLEPDIIVLLGDYISHFRQGERPPMEIEAVANYLAPLKAKYGVFAVLGNHDGVYGNDRIANALTSKGIRVLQNEIASVDHNGRTLRLLGLNDHMQFIEWRFYDEQIRRVLAADGREGDIIVLQHSPDVFRLVKHFDLPGKDHRLMIAGHSHGGQVWFPIIGSPLVPSSYGQRYRMGHIREEGKDLFVTTGIGTSVLPFRFLVPPEIALLKLVREE